MKMMENDVLKISVADHGAELSSVYDKESGFERIWCADPAVWDRHAPILFPFVGNVKGRAYRYKGQTYEMKKQHGFARDMDFECIAVEKDQIVHRCTATEKTKEIYPFDFELTVTHRLDEENPRKLYVIWDVKNNGTDDMYFIIGGHPGFNLPDGDRKTDYYLNVPGQDEYALTTLNMETGYATPWNPIKLVMDQGYCKIDEQTLYDTYIWDDYQVKEITLAKPDKAPYVTVKCDGFPSMGVWGSPKADYVCLEPWIGRVDDDDATGNLEEKRDVQVAAAGETRHYTYSIEFHRG